MRGLRITIYEILEYLASEITQEEILEDFPALTREDLKACIAYAVPVSPHIILDVSTLPKKNESRKVEK